MGIYVEIDSRPFPSSAPNLYVGSLKWNELYVPFSTVSVKEQIYASSFKVKDIWPICMFWLNLKSMI